MAEIKYVINEVPVFGVPTRVAENIYLVRLPLPFALDHVNVWLLEEQSSWTIIDTGVGSADCLVIWEDLLCTFLKLKPVTRIILTHYHPDHIGLSGDLVDRTDASVFMSRTEWLMSNMLYHDVKAALGARMLNLFVHHGLPRALEIEMEQYNSAYRDRCSLLPGHYFRLKDQDVIRIADENWQCRVGQGHNPEHICLYNKERKILIAGDHILPKITPNIPMPVQDESANPIAAFIASLMTFADIDNDVLILPSHRLPFMGARDRIDQLIDHHHDRLSLLYQACDNFVSIYDILPVLFHRKLDSNQMSFAMLEALAHMVYLYHEGKVEKQEMNHICYWKQK